METYAVQILHFLLSGLENLKKISNLFRLKLKKKNRNEMKNGKTYAVTTRIVWELRPPSSTKTSTVGVIS